MTDVTGKTGYHQPPRDILENEQTAFVEVMKKNVVGMLPADTFEVIPFTQREYDEVFKYRSEPGRPNIHPLLFLRASSTKEIEEALNWQPDYEKLFEGLPPDVKEWLAWELKQPFEERDPNFVALNNLLIGTAIGLQVLSSATQPIKAGSPEERDLQLNISLPYNALRSSIARTTQSLTAGNAWLSQVGPNHPQHDAVSNIVRQMDESLGKLNELRGHIETGEMNPTIKQQIIELSNTIDRLDTEFKQTQAGNEMTIVGQSLESMNVIAQAWGLPSGSPPLFIGLFFATEGLSVTESQGGLLGAGVSTIADSILRGALEALDFGPRTELVELHELRSDLVVLQRLAGR